MIKLLYISILTFLLLGYSDYKIESEYDLIIKEYLSNVFEAQDSVENFHLSKYTLLGEILQPDEIYLYKNDLKKNINNLLVTSKSGFGWIELHSLKIVGNNFDEDIFLNFENISTSDNEIIDEPKSKNTLIKQFSDVNKIIIFEELFKTRNDFIVFKNQELYYIGLIDDDSKIYDTNDSINLFYEILDNGEHVIKEY